MSPKTSILIAIVMLALLAVAIWAREAHADPVYRCQNNICMTEEGWWASSGSYGGYARETDCSSATQREAMAEYDQIAGMVGIPAGAPIYTLEKRQYVAAVCLHEELHGR